MESGTPGNGLFALAELDGRLIISAGMAGVGNGNSLVLVLPKSELLASELKAGGGGGGA